MSFDYAIRVRSVRKSFPLYSKPHHRLLQILDRSGSRRWFDEFTALREVSVDIRRGETVGIVGRNGSGKSTFLQIVCGTLTPSQGEVEVNGRVAALLELGAGFNPDFTGRENVFLNAGVLGLSREETVANYDDIVAFADIGDFIDQPVKTYSSGMFVRLAFAVAIHVSPEILIIDEALSVGDEAFQRKCFAKIEKMRESGVTILFVSHSAGAVVELCDRAILLDRGELLMEGEPKHVISLYQKMLYAPTEKLDGIREEIAAGAAHHRPASERVLPQPRGEEPDTRADDASYFDEGLVPQSTLTYESVGVRLSQPRIETADGRLVNVLVPGRSYVYTYRAHFQHGFAGVRCGMMIKNITGIEVGGAATGTVHDDLPWIEAGEEVVVRFSFRCLLAPGTYFLNAGVLGLVDGAESYLTRSVDVAMFRVLPDSARLATAMVDLDFSPQLIRGET